MADEAKQANALDDRSIEVLENGERFFLMELDPMPKKLRKQLGKSDFQGEELIRFSGSRVYVG